MLAGTNTTSGPTPTTVSRGRVIVFLFQKDLDESRVVGLKTVLDGCRALVMRLGPDDRAAILSFDSHLKLWVDLTADKLALLQAIDREILFGDAPPVVAAPPPSLGSGLDPIRARDASTLEQALALTAKALAPIAGAKSLVLAGWGFGRLVMSRVLFDDEYQAACRSLQRARVAVFSLDVTQAEYHSLEAGLRSVADATGGFYAKADPSPSVALARLDRALAGHYELLVEPPDSLRRGEHVIKVSLTRVRGTLLSRPSYVD